MSIAWVFPGQGSQKPGMAEQVMSLPGALERFELASQVLGRDLLEICGKNESKKEGINDLDDTRNTQPALFTVESLLVDEMKRQGREAQLLAGHSLGEFVALYGAEVIDVKTALVLLKRRSELMAQAGGGAMTAVMGFDRNQLEELVEATEGVVIANDNSSAQVVLSGSEKAINSVISNLSCKRAIPLKVSGAFHSPFMEEASNTFAVELDKASFSDAIIPVLSNASPKPICDCSILKERVKAQMTTGVRWRETMQEMMSQGITNLVEIGPGNVLGGLAKRSMPGISINQLATAIDLGY